MKTISRRLCRLEESHAAQRNEQGLTPAEALRERLCRRVAQERGVPYEEVLRESINEHQVFMANYVGDGTIADTLRSRSTTSIRGCGSSSENSTELMHRNP
jgi:hypothetical protein